MGKKKINKWFAVVESVDNFVLLAKKEIACKSVVFKFQVGIVTVSPHHVMFV